MTAKRDRIKLWRDSSLPDGLELLRATCFDHSYPAHFHDEFVIAAFAHGAQRHRISRHEGIAEAGTLMIIQPGEIHTGEAAERDRGWNYCAFYPSAGFLERIADDVLGSHGHVDFGRDILRHDPVVTRHLLLANRLIGASPDILEKECAAYEAFGAVIGRYGARATSSSTSKHASKHIQHAVDYLEDHYDRPIVVRDVASVTGLSEYHFMRSFRASTGLSVHRYLTQIRLRRAKALLTHGVSAAQTALNVGLFDQSHLINQFRAHFGVTPGAFVAASR